MIDQQRYQLEKDVLRQEHFPENAYRFVGIGTSEPYLRIAAKCNSGKVYTLHIDLKEFPEQIPEVYVTKMLKDYNGNDMDHPSATLHTLTAKNGWTRICHYGSNSWRSSRVWSGSEWVPSVSLYRIYIKCRLWLEAYEAHLATGNNLDYYLKHAQ